MKNYRKSILRNAFTEEHGQVLPWVAFMMVLFLGMGAFVLDIGHAYYCYQELQAATDAAALAGAQQIRTANPVGTATTFGAVTGSLNTNPNLSLGGLNSVSMVPGYPQLECLNAITAMGISCTPPNNANAIQVKEQAIVPTFFARVFGISQMTLSTTATAAVSGAKGVPLNLAIIVDTTASMKTVDTNCDGGAPRITCAESGVAVLLQNLYPCNQALGCGAVTDGVASNALDSVSIFTFPPVTNGTMANDFNCSGTNPTIVPYTLPDIGSSTYAPTGSGTGNYQITSFQ